MIRLALVVRPCGNRSLRHDLRRHRQLHRLQDPLPGYEERDGETGKQAKYFSEAPGQGG
jgi:hypothetical protein